MANQFIALIKRLIFVNINFGKNLSNFLEEIAGIVTVKSVETSYEYERFLSPSTGKFDRFGISLKFEENLKIKSFVYLFGYLMEIFSFLIIVGMERSKEISVKKFKIIKILRKIKFVTFGISMMDLFFFGTRFLIHADLTVENAYEKLLVGICLLLIGYDLVNLLNSVKDAQKKILKKFQILKKILSQDESAINLNTLRENSHKTKIKKQKFKKIKFDQTLKFIKKVNTAHQDFLRGNLNLEKNYKNSKNPFYSNFIFTTRLLCYQLLIVALPHLPSLQIYSFFVIEFLYLIFNVFSYLKYRHFLNFIVFLSKIIQSVFILLLFMIFLSAYKKNKNNRSGSFDSVLSSGMQNTSILMILLAIFVEYGFTFLIIFWDVLVKIYETVVKKKKKDAAGVDDIEGFFYEEGEENDVVLKK